MTIQVYKCKEWQCRHVFPDGRCCRRKIGHEGNHAPTRKLKVEKECTPVWGSCSLPTSHSGLHDANVRRVFECVGGCGYKVAFPNLLCGECSCEDDGAIW
jgi:hypothetical protein